MLAVFARRYRTSQRRVGQRRAYNVSLASIPLRQSVADSADIASQANACCDAL